MAKRTSARKRTAPVRKAPKKASSKKLAKKKARSVRKKAAPSPKAASKRAAPLPRSRPLPETPTPSAARPAIFEQLIRDRRALRIASIVLGIIALAHLIRFVTGFTLIVDDVVLPITASGFIVVIFGVLAVWYYRLSLD